MWYSYLKIAGVKEDVLRIVGEDSNLLNQIRQICPEPKFQTTIAYFLIKGTNSDQLSQYVQKLAKLQQAQKLKSLFVSKSGVHFNDRIFTDWIGFTESVDGLMPPPTIKDFQEKHQASEDTLISEGENIEVHKAKNVVDAIRLGNGMSWCISQPGNTMYQSYRDTQASTFYFIVDNNKDASDPLHRVVVDVTKDRPLLTDVNNTTGSISEFGKDTYAYFDYLENRGVDTSVFVNDPITPEEKIEKEELQRKPIRMQPEERLEWFKKLSFEYKSKFIGRGNILSAREFEYLIKNNLKDLVTQYLNSGLPVSADEFALISNNNQWRNTYIRARGNILQNPDVNISEHDLKIPGLVMPLYETGKISFSRLPNSLRHDPEFALQALVADRVRFHNLKPSLKSDPEFAMQALKNNKTSYVGLTESLKSDPEFTLKAWEAGFVMFSDLPKSMKENKSIALAAWNTGRAQFFELPGSLFADPKFALQAWEDGRADFSFLPQSLQKDPKFALEAWNAGKADYMRLPELLKEDPKIATEALMSGKVRYDYLSRPLRDNPEITLKALQYGGVAFRDINFSLQENPQFAMRALMAGVISFSNLPQVFQSDPEFSRFNPKLNKGSEVDVV